MKLFQFRFSRKRIVLNCAMVSSAVVGAVRMDKQEEKSPQSTLVRRSELPAYSEAPSHPQRNLEENVNPVVFSVIQSFRKEACKVARTTQSLSDRCKRFVNTGIAHSYNEYVTTTEFLREKKNLIPRIGAISAGAFFGFLLGFRRRFFKRLSYSITSGAVVAAICYPTEAEQYLQHSVQSSKKYAIISYHFLNGVTKDLGGFELPALPSKNESMKKIEKKE